MAPSPAVAAVTAELAGAEEGARDAVLERFWARVDAAGTPLVEPVAGAPGTPRVGPDTGAADDRIVTFLWRDRHGVGPGTRGVLLLANKLTDPTVPDHSALERLPGTDVWHRAFRLSAAWRGTYALAPDDGDAPVEDAALGPASRWRGLATRAQPDPGNARTFPGARGGAPLSVLELPEAPSHAHLVPRPDVPRGTVTEWTVPGTGPADERRAWVHVPAGSASNRDGRASRGADRCADADESFDGEPGPAGDGGGPAAHDGSRADGDGPAPRARPHRLLVLLDGDEWMGRRDAPAILDALHHAGRIPPLATLMLDGGDTARRWRDMTAGAPYLDLLTRVLPAWAREHVPALADEAPGGVLLAGQSLGGLAVLQAAMHAPDAVAGVVAQSSSLWFPDQEHARSPSPAGEALAAAPPHDVRLHVEVGRDEWVLLPAHRALRDALTRRGADLHYVEYEGGHDALCWRGGLADGLQAVTRG